MATAVVRNSAGLVETLFDTIDKLNKQEIDAEHARAISHSARSIVQIARLEMDFRQLENSERLKLVSLAIPAKQ